MRNLPALARLEGAYIESILPVRAFATLTAVRRFSEARICGAFSEWIRGIQAHERLTLGWVRAVEDYPQRHIHAALVAAGELDCKYAERLWKGMVAQHYEEAALVEPYWPNLGGLGYILKQLPQTGDGIQFSSNLPAFAYGGGKSIFRANSAERRHQRRIRAQLAAELRAPPFRHPLR